MKKKNVVVEEINEGVLLFEGVKDDVNGETIPENVEAIAEKVVEKAKKERIQLVLCNIDSIDYLFETNLPIKTAQHLLSKIAKNVFVTPKDKYDNRTNNEDFLQRYPKQINRMEQLEISNLKLEQWLKENNK